MIQERLGEVSAAALSLVTPVVPSVPTLPTLPLLGIIVPSSATGEAGEVSAAALSLVVSVVPSVSILPTLPLLGIIVPSSMAGEAGEVSAAALSLVVSVCAEADRGSVASKPTADSADTDRKNPLLVRLLMFIIRKTFELLFKTLRFLTMVLVILSLGLPTHGLITGGFFSLPDVVFDKT